MAKMYCITDDGAFMASDQTTAQEFLNSILAAQFNLFNNILRQAPEEEQTKLKEELYDMFNFAASAFLKAFDPERDLRPDLTAEAILAAENAFVEDAYKGQCLQGSARLSAAKIRKQMEEDGLITPVRQTEDGTIIPLNRKERRSIKGGK